MRRRGSPITVFHVVLFVLGGGLWLIWSWWGALLVALALLSLYAVARAMTSSANIGATRSRLERLQRDLTDLRAMVDHPDSPSSQSRGHELLERYGIESDGDSSSTP